MFERTRNTRPLLVTVAIAAVISITAVAEKSPDRAKQSRRWRIGVGGVLCNGYWGMLGKAGLPRERLMWGKPHEYSHLSRYDVVLLNRPAANRSRVSNAVQRFVRNGGIAITTLTVWPSKQALPGKRIGRKRGPNMRFIESACPASKGLPEMGLLKTTRRRATSIIPDAGQDNVYILARFTDKKAHKKTKGRFRDGDKGAPAVILFKHGKGWWMWIGTRVGYWMLRHGAHSFAKPIMNVLNFVSDGELRRQWSLKSGPGHQRLATADKPPKRSEKPRPEGDNRRPPDGYEIWDSSVRRAGEFDITGELDAGKSATVLSSYWNEKSYRAVEFKDGRVSIIRTEGGKRHRVASATAPGLSGNGDKKIRIRRRNALVTVWIDRQPVLEAIDGPPQQGVVAIRGLSDVACQPAAPVRFHDDFMRTEDEKSSWKEHCGSWKIEQERGDLNKGQVSRSVNPFRYRGKAGNERPAVSTTGRWFWNDYYVETAVRPRSQQIGLIGHYDDENDNITFRVTVTDSREKQSQAVLIRHSEDRQVVLGRGRCRCIKGQWAHLALRLSGGHIQGVVDGQVVVEGKDNLRGNGPCGLYVAGGSAEFDDVNVRPWITKQRNPTNADPARWLAEAGSCQVADDATHHLKVSGKKKARILAPWAGGQAYRCRTTVNLQSATRAGIYFRYTSPERHYRLWLEPTQQDSRRTRVQLQRKARGQTITLGDIVIPSSPDERHVLAVRAADEYIQAWVDERKIFDMVDDGPQFGKVGMYVENGTAVFGQLDAVPTEKQQHPVTQTVPSFAGTIDRNTWAGRPNYWFPDPNDMQLAWHRSEIVGDVTVKTGVRREARRPQTTVSLYLADGEDPDSGYEVRAVRRWKQNTLELRILRREKLVAYRKLTMEDGSGEFEAQMVRAGKVLAFRIDDETVLSFREGDWLEDVRHVGIRLSGATFNPIDTRVETPHARRYTFGHAPTGWAPRSGQWKVASRWTCSPGWTWFAGWSKKHAWITNKQAFGGDQRMDVFVGAKMIKIPGKKRAKEVLEDVYLGLCTTPGKSDSGYWLKFKDNWTMIEKNGDRVARTRWQLPQGGRHNDWALVSARKHGNNISVWWEGWKILEYEDDDPISEGHPALGTYRNGIMIPKITIFGKVTR